MSRLLRVLIAALSLIASEVWAQQPLERTPTSRGRIRDTNILLAAQDAAARAGVDCQVTAALLRGIDIAGDRHYEVACRDAPGHLIITGLNNTAYNCLLLASQYERLERGGSSTRGVPVCTLEANRNPTRYLASMARDAGVNCQVDQARVVGLSPNDSAIYEIGCRGAVGAWIEQTSRGWTVTDCLEVRSRQDLCQFTTSSEELAGFRRWLAGSEAAFCVPTRLRAMGRNSAGLSYFEVACGGRGSIVVSLDGNRDVANVLSCVEAAHIGDGCRLTARQADE